MIEILHFNSFLWRDCSLSNLFLSFFWFLMFSILAHLQIACPWFGCGWLRWRLILVSFLSTCDVSQWGTFDLDGFFKSFIFDRLCFAKFQEKNSLTLSSTWSVSGVFTVKQFGSLDQSFRSAAPEMPPLTADAVDWSKASDGFNQLKARYVQVSVLPDNFLQNSQKIATLR